MARTAAQLEQALAAQMDLRFSAKSPEVKRLAHERIEYLRGELKLQREHEARQAADQRCAVCGGSYRVHVESRYVDGKEEHYLEWCK